ncbi:MAG: UDP-glycosyltransferase [Flavobacterium sp.]
MNILVANNYFDKMGGSETFCFTLIEELKRAGHKVEYFTFYKGIISEKIETELGVNFMSESKYDLILANHDTCVRYLAHKGKIIQTCHGVFPPLEQPSRFADGYVSISEEVAAHLLSKGFKSKVILNGINCDRFSVKKPINTQLKKVLSLCQSDVANNSLKKACDILGISMIQLNKHINPQWQVEQAINEVDLVVGLGRSAYEGMACGRPVLVFDDRGYFESYSDGYLNKNNIDYSIINNCSGRFYKKKLDLNELVIELQKYNPQDGLFLREYALKNLNIKNQVEKYLEYADSLKPSKFYLLLHLLMWAYFLKNNFKRKKKEVKKAIKLYFSGNRH